MTDRAITRGDFVRQVLAIWKQSLAIEPKLRAQFDIAQEWLAKTWTPEELAQPFVIGEYEPRLHPAEIPHDRADCENPKACPMHTPPGERN